VDTGATEDAASRRPAHDARFVKPS